MGLIPIDNKQYDLHQVYIPLSLSGSSTGPRIMDKNSLAELEERNKQLLPEFEILSPEVLQTENLTLVPT